MGDLESQRSGFGGVGTLGGLSGGILCSLGLGLVLVLEFTETGLCGVCTGLLGLRSLTFGGGGSLAGVSEVIGCRRVGTLVLRG